MSELIEVGRTSRGYTIYRQENGVGGHIYWSDEVGGGVIVWDTSLINPDSIIFAMLVEGSMPCAPLTQRQLIYKIAGRK
jgi:hypothetical protein